MAKELDAIELDEILDDLTVHVCEIADMKPTNAWPPEIRTLIAAARAVTKRYGMGSITIPTGA